ncbi:MAG: type II 3-dehydroquinate dehydratase [Candidatus Aminicenantia bacterium]
MRILIINGPNLNLLGKRDIDIYGEKTMEEIYLLLKERAKEINVEIELFQSNHEGKIIDMIHNSEGFDGIIINPGALSHYSYSLRDALDVLKIPVVEVHISNIFSREDFRTRSVTAPVCNGFLSGFGWKGYLFALDIICHILREKL